MPGSHVKAYKLDDEVTRRSNGNPLQVTGVIVTLVPGAAVPAEFRKYARGGKLDIINGQVLELPNGLLKKLGAHADVFRVHFDRATGTHNYRTSVTVGARNLNAYGLKGSGVGIAVIDSGVSYHDDLSASSAKIYPYGNQRVAKFVDFVNGRTLPYDDNGHGTHVAGTIVGNGTDSKGLKAGIAPAASLVSLKVLDANGQGTISRIIAALNWVALNGKTYNIRVVNMSVGAGVYESYWTDPLTLAAKAVTDKGITVVAAAGNLGKNSAGQLQWGGITAPGNAPWVLTVGASSTMGTDTRSDDKMGDYSSSGPTHIDFAAKPDLVAPGTGTVSLAVAGSTLYATKAAYLVDGSSKLGYKPYLSLTGTSMAAPVVTGTIALMLEANPNLTPNLIKAILQYTAQSYPGYSGLRQGAGFLDSTGAVWMAWFYKNAQPGDKYPYLPTFSQSIIWGSHRLTGGIINPAANAWDSNIVWGTARTLGLDGANIVWGTMSNSEGNIVWGTENSEGNIVWGTQFADNIVWGTSFTDNIVWGTMSADSNIVWGTALGSDNIVWGTDCGGADCGNVVWGTMSADSNIVWGTAMAYDNIVWGTMSADSNIVWGTASDANLTWATSTENDVLFADDPVSDPLPSDGTQFDPANFAAILPVESNTLDTVSVSTGGF